MAAVVPPVRYTVQYVITFTMIVQAHDRGRMATPRRHHHLSREAIAWAALELVDQDGFEALTLRRVADGLDVGVMNLYTYVRDKNALVRDIVALLLGEIELPDDPDMTWEEGVFAVGHSLRAMALRHPRAFRSVALASYDEPAVARYARRVEATLVWLGFPAELLPQLATVLDSHGTGFLLLETRQVAPPREDVPGPFDDDPETSALLHSQLDPDTAFDDSLRVIVAGFKVVHGLPDGQRRSERAI